MRITTSRFKQLIQEEMASLAEIEEEAEEEESEWTGRDWEEAEDLRRQETEDEERHNIEAEYADIVVAFRNILDGILGKDFPEYDFYNELKSIADYAMEHRHRWEDAAPERGEHASELGGRIAASQEERGMQLPRVTRAGIDRMRGALKRPEKPWPKKWRK